MRNELMPVLIVLFILLLIARIYITIGQRRRKRLRVLHRLVAVRYQSSPDYSGDRTEFEEAIKETRRTFGDASPVITSLDAYRDHMVRGEAELAQRRLNEAIRAICREMKMDPETASLNLSD
jgi:hypothetical protein